MMQITDLAKEEQIPPIWRLGFRPFFLAGAIFSLLAIVTWILILRGSISYSPLGGGYWWHIHEMIFGFGCAIVAGFLLTAVQNWTGMPGVKGKTLIFLFGLWLLGRVVIFAPEVLGQTTSQLIDVLFLPTVAFILGKPIVAIKQFRNLFFVPLLLLFTIANIEMHLALTSPESFSIQLSGYAGVMLTTFLMSVMAGRVAPMFTANGTKTTKASPSPMLDKLANGSLGIAMFALLLHPIIRVSDTYLGYLLIFAGLTQTIRWMGWRPWITLSVPLLWSLHGALKFICFGLLLLGFSYVIPEIPTNHSWHLLTIGGMGGLILAMISRVSLGHTGRPLSPPKSMSVAFIVISFSALVRTLGPWLSPEQTLFFYDISGLLWVIAFGIFTYCYAPMLLRSRADGRPG